MTVKELIGALRQVPEEATVSTEGCDCVDDAHGVVLQDGVVYIARFAGSYIAKRKKEIIYKDEGF